MRSNFNTSHYLAVERARIRKGLPTRKDYMLPNNGEVENHPMVGRRILNDGKLYIIEHVHEHWVEGWYHMAIARCEGTRSHATFFVHNISSHNNVIKEAVQEFSERTVFLSSDL